MGRKNLMLPGETYYTTSTVVGWIDIFTKPIYKEMIISSLKYCQKEKQLEIFAWVLMTNHLHLISRTPENLTVSDVLRGFKQYTSKRIINIIESEHESRKDWMLYQFKYYGEISCNNLKTKVWQEGNEPKLIETNSFLQQKVDYIHENPVKAGFVLEPFHYLYSSALNYAGEDGLLDVTLV